LPIDSPNLIASPGVAQVWLDRCDVYSVFRQLLPPESREFHPQPYLFPSSRERRPSASRRPCILAQNGFDFPWRCNTRWAAQGESAAGQMIYGKKTPNTKGGPGKELNCEPIGELLRFRSSCASASSNPAPPPVSQRYSFCGKRSPTSDSRIAAIRTSSCTAWPRLRDRNGNNTSASWEPRPKLETGSPGQLPTLFPEGLRFESPAGFCGLVISCFILARERGWADSAEDGILWYRGSSSTITSKWARLPGEC
jgi:hypothetical protein